MIVVKVDTVAVDEEIARSPEWRMHCEKLAQEGVSYARSIAPVVTGEYRDSLFAEVGAPSVLETIPGAPAIRVGTNSDYGMEVEFQEPMRHLVLLRTFDHLKSGG